MAKYQVIRDFTDSQDEDHVYRKGDKYPRTGRAKKERVEELSGTENALGYAVIEEVDEEGGK